MLQERVEELEHAAETASVKLAASQERMGAMCDMLRGAATIAFGGSDLSARRIRHHMFQCALAAPWPRDIPRTN